MTAKNRNSKGYVPSPGSDSMSASRKGISPDEILIARQMGIPLKEILAARQMGISLKGLHAIRQSGISLVELLAASQIGISPGKALNIRQKSILRKELRLRQSNLFRPDTDDSPLHKPRNEKGNNKITKRDNFIIYILKKCSSRESIEDVFTQYKINDKAKRVAKLNASMGNPQTFFFSDDVISVDDEYELTIQMFLTESWKLLKIMRGEL